MMLAMPKPCRSDPATAGFTLVEMMVALVLAGLVGLILLRGVGVAAAGLGRLTQRAEGIAEQRAIEMTLGRVLASAVALPAPDGVPAFVGRPTSLTFLSVADDGGPGLYIVRLALWHDRTRQAITYSRQLAAASGHTRGAGGILVHNVRSFSLAYFGAASAAAEPAWHRDWQGLVGLPKLVRIMLETDDDRVSPPIVLRLGDGA